MGRVDQILPLNPTNRFKSDLYLSELTFDRLVSTPLVLPYNRDDISIPVNEFVGSSINSVLYKLNYNNLYLYSRFLSYNNALPEKVATTVGITSGAQVNLSWFNSTPTLNLSTFGNSPFYFDISQFVDIHATWYNVENNFTIYGCTSSHLIVLTGNKITNNVGIVYKTSLTRDDLNNTKTFTYITDVLLHENYLYIVDNGGSAVYKYDVSRLQNSSSTGNRVYVTSVGGNYEGVALVDKPKFITKFTDNNVILYDSLSNKFVLVDQDFNVIITKSLTLRTETVLNVGWNHYYNTLYILTSKDNKLQLHVFDSNLIKQESYTLNETLITNEVVKTIQFSYNSSNIFYIATNYRVIKKLVNTPVQSIGTILPKTYYTSNTPSSATVLDPTLKFTGFTIFPSVGNFDNIITTSTANITILQEPNSFIKTIGNDDVEAYSISNIGVLKDQYMQSNYINAQIYITLKNLLTLKNQFLGKFNTIYTSTGKLVEQNGIITVYADLTIYGYKYITDYNFINIANQNDFFIHENERVTPLAINRCLSFIYDIQQLLLENSNIVVDNVAAYANTSQELVLT